MGRGRLQRDSGELHVKIELIVIVVVAGGLVQGKGGGFLHINSVQFSSHFGDVVAQLAKAAGRHQTEEAAVPGSNPAPPQSPERGQDISLCIIKKNLSK
jgi:hypothetical protein